MQNLLEADEAAGPPIPECFHPVYSRRSSSMVNKNVPEE